MIYAHCVVDSIEVVEDEETDEGGGEGRELGGEGVKVWGIFQEEVEGEPEGGGKKAASQVA